MKFSTRIDQDVPAEEMFDAVANFDRIERMLMRRGVSVRRNNDMSVGSRSWDLAFDWRGQRREVNLVLTRFDRPEHLTMTGQSAPFDMVLDMSVVALSRQKSRLIFELDVKPRNMRARLALQTAKLGKTQLDRKIAKKVGAFIDDTLS
ncbi:hypothetical protein FQV27_04145 [Paracoccus aurantiacus]|uniref:SRPBCC family protein n=1 Tax=Paracoccus aurantiacus TaxID=2599412 RepID=A0A5C6S9B4_9RHOB|nr:hypothetical protein [Paracoccus aurantiacus]TXB71046.1 hypothetical protein FQV27_04145 [Paracoccus aurantiacus]